ncbi:MAG: thiamine pyrophosphate-binding protein [Xanthobacteraceae bacterium]|nr:thiamine pyrophosphate-binding protein [Xanthobacteraceae bacterium]
MTVQERTSSISAKAQSNARTGGRILVDQLLIHGADLAFCVPGESYLEVLDALYDVRDRFKLVNARHESGAANMAEAYGKLTGKPGICMVTRGPGACHASIGVHTAYQDSTPMILLVGQIARGTRDREAFQEIDYRQMFGPVAKWAAEIETTARIPEYMARAFQIATSGRPGPVVLALPEDMLSETADVEDAKPYVTAQAAPDAAQMNAMRELLAKSERPLLIVGGSGWSDQGCRGIVAFAEANGIPAACSFRRQDVFDNASENYVGDLSTSVAASLTKRVKEADLLLVVGARLGEITTQTYRVIESPTPKPKLIHVYADADEIGRVYVPDLAIVSSSSAFAEAAAGLPPIGGAKWKSWRESARKDYVEASTAPAVSFPLDMGKAMGELAKALPEDFVVTIDAGNFSGWPQRFLRYARPCRQLGPTSGAMGYSVPAAVAASIADPRRVVVSFVGDGGFLMSGQEIGTAVQHGGKPIVLLFNNRMYGTIRMHQEREYPARVSGTDLVNPDFVAFAKAFGCHAERVEKTADFMPAFERALKSGKAAVIELMTDPEQVSSRTTIAALRASKRH